MLTDRTEVKDSGERTLPICLISVCKSRFIFSKQMTPTACVNSHQTACNRRQESP